MRTSHSARVVSLLMTVLLGFQILVFNSQAYALQETERHEKKTSCFDGKWAYAVALSALFGGGLFYKYWNPKQATARRPSHSGPIQFQHHNLDDQPHSRTLGVGHGCFSSIQILNNYPQSVKSKKPSEQLQDSSRPETLERPSQLDQNLNAWEAFLLKEALEYIRKRKLIERIRAEMLSAEELVEHLAILSSIMQNGREERAPFRGSSEDNEIVIWLPEFEAIRSEMERMKLVRSSMSPLEFAAFLDLLEQDPRADNEKQRELRSRYLRDLPSHWEVPKRLLELARTFLAMFTSTTDADAHAAFAHQGLRYIHPFMDATNRLSGLFLRLVYAVRKENLPHFANYLEYRKAADRDIKNPSDFAEFLKSQRGR